jgi:RhtB (resistance to homoserine/threonine) family protein
MDGFFSNWLMLIVVFTVALASPGPDFVMAVRNSVMGSRKAGIFTAIGFGLGVAIHVSYCLAGLALVISQSVMAFNIIKWIGAAYLFYVGWQALKSKGYTPPEDGAEARPAMTPVQALRSGFITNLFNPKATLFFLALFTQILSPDIAMAAKIVYGLTCIVMTMIWFSIVATVLTTPRIRAAFLRASKWIDRVCGGLFVALGIKLAVTRL